MDTNKRKFSRVNYPCSITVGLQDGSEDIIMANTANISVGGICVYFNETLVLGSLLDIKIDNSFEGGPLKHKGKVVRCQPDKTHQSEWQKYFEIGIEFLETDQNQRKYLEGFVERLTALEAKNKN